MNTNSPAVNQRVPTCIMALLCLLFGVSPAAGKVYRVYYLGGQSNMDGFGTTAELDKQDQRRVDGCLIYQGTIRGKTQVPDGAGIWATLTPGFGWGFSSDGTTNQMSDRFGPELSFGRAMQKLYPGEHIAIIKYSRGGSSIALETGAPCWDPDDRREEGGLIGINQYDHALKTIDQAMAIRDIDGDGEEDTLIPCGIVWMQGESDGVHEGAAGEYAKNLERLMELIRAALRADELPMAIGRISDSGVQAGTQRIWKFGDTIRKAQAEVCDADPMAELVTSTDEYGYSDPYHYDTAGYMDLGRRFAQALYMLDPSKEQVKERTEDAQTERKEGGGG